MFWLEAKWVVSLCCENMHGKILQTVSAIYIDPLGDCREYGTEYMSQTVS